MASIEKRVNEIALDLFKQSGKIQEIQEVLGPNFQLLIKSFSIAIEERLKEIPMGGNLSPQQLDAINRQIPIGGAPLKFEPLKFEPLDIHNYLSGE